MPKCIDKEVAQFDKDYAAKQNTIEFCSVHKATNSYGGFIETSDCTGDSQGFGSWTTVPPAPTTPAVTAAEQARAAQAYADCLKLAINNPKIACNQ